LITNGKSITKRKTKTLENNMGKVKKINASKQLTLDRLPVSPKTESANLKTIIRKKQIIINEIDSVTREDELALNVEFRLLPSKAAFSKVKFDLSFDGQQISSVAVRVIQGPLARDDFDLSPVLDMKGIPAGPHVIKVEMYELWSTGEKLCQTTKEVSLNYVPQTRESRLLKVPIVKSVAGANLAVVSESEKGIYREIEENMKKELISKRDEW
jgi:hypothetical protein